MKRTLVLVIAAIMVVGLAIAAVAYTRTTVDTTTAACCCCSGDSCPMKGKDAAHKNAAHTDKASCCDGAHKGGHHMGMMNKDAKKGDHHEGAASCPMMKKGDSKVAAEAGVAIAPASDKDASCSCPCCQQMMEKQAAPQV